MKDSIMHIQYKGRFASLDLQKKKKRFSKIVFYTCVCLSTYTNDRIFYYLCSQVKKNTLKLTNRTFNFT